MNVAVTDGILRSVSGWESKASGRDSDGLARKRRMFLRRMVVYLAGVVILCLGVVLNTRTGLGTAAMSTIPYSIQLIEGISLGTASFAIYCIFVVLQLIMVRYFDVKILLQIPVSLLFGVLTDVFDIWVLPFRATGLVDGLVMLAFAITLTGLGVTLVVSARLVPVATDGMVQTLAQKLGWEFGKTKYLFDGTCASITIVYSLVRVGHVVGIGLGTIAAVLLTGGVCTCWGRLLKRPIADYVNGGSCA